MSKSKKISLKDNQAEHFGLTINTSGRYKISDTKLLKEIKAYLLDKGTYQQKTALRRLDIPEDKIETVKKKAKSIEPDLKFSAAYNGRIMDIDEYCEHYSLPREDITSYKLVTHTSVPYYNTQFKEITTEPTVDVEDFESLLKS